MLLARSISKEDPKKQARKKENHQKQVVDATCSWPEAFPRKIPRSKPESKKIIKNKSLAPHAPGQKHFQGRSQEASQNQRKSSKTSRWRPMLLARSISKEDPKKQARIKENHQKQVVGAPCSWPEAFPRKIPRSKPESKKIIKNKSLAPHAPGQKHFQGRSQEASQNQRKSSKTSR